LPRVWCNRHHLRRVIVNLVRNAIIHNPPGTHVRMLVTTRGTGYIVRIWDTGTGLPEASGKYGEINFKNLVERIKNQIHAPTETESGEASHGIGLQSVDELCTAMNMPLELYTRFKLGAIFKFRLEYAA
jgi:K+-sensing histidine kinase KdpD